MRENEEFCTVMIRRQLTINEENIREFDTLKKIMVQKANNEVALAAGRVAAKCKENRTEMKEMLEVLEGKRVHIGPTR